MKALVLRFYKFIGPAGLVMVLGSILMTPLVIIVVILDQGNLFNNGATAIYGKAVVLTFISLVVAVTAARHYKRSSRTMSHEDVLLPLVFSEREYCLTLRPFGQDGQIIIPQANGKGRVGMPFTNLTKNVTMEQLVATAARNSLGVETYGIVDQEVLFAPPGVTFIRASNNEWKGVVERLIKRAHTIVLILYPGQEMRKGFAWEIEQIVRYGMQSRVIIALPPFDNDVYGHHNALAQACVILALLDGSGREAELDHFKMREYQLLLDPTTLLIRHRERGGPSWQLAILENGAQQGVVSNRYSKEQRKEKKGNKKKAVIADGTYLPGFVELFKEVEDELSGLSFEARYSLK